MTGQEKPPWVGAWGGPPPHPCAPPPSQTQYRQRRYSQSSHFRPNFFPILLILTMGVSPIFFRISGKILGDFTLKQRSP